MYNFEEELAKYGLTQEKYEQLLKDCSNKVQHITDDDWSEICARYGLEFNPDTIRKGSQPPLIGSAFVSEYYKWKESLNQSENKDDEYFEKLRLEKQEIQKEKRKLYDERLDINRRLREEARLETTIEKIDDMLNSIADNRYITYNNNFSIEQSDNDMIVCLSDLHLGATYYNFDGYYDSNIAKERLNQYLAEIIEIQKTHNAENCVVLLLGDLISGNIHSTISVTNKENVIEQVKLACEYISDFVYELGKHFNNVELRGVSGNHSRIQEKKENALLGERLDSLIVWFIKSMLKNADNIIVYDENIDETVSTFIIRDKLYFGVHGDFDSTNSTSIAKLALWVKMTPYCILCGHKHFPAMTDVSGIKVVQSGSLGGSGDEYTRQKRLTGKPSQTVLIVNNKGIKCCYPIELD
ncbi:metallophosphoesterase [Eubacterium sp. BX4]|uniref:Metallophosphoesterase n=1 Tax=Eubacterium segne TaxID=2763045 RepID=A0ABR7F1F6_9FIRM|nr:metallophosphoesterase [Eubacterium segne]MBC5667401.1 metallophosphoesterase [Eubacterium segne]